jgi:hypothetical protein
MNKTLSVLMVLAASMAFGQEPTSQLTIMYRRAL